MEFSMDLSIIIVNWNSAEYLRDCLASLYRETLRITFEVIVIDNASYDGCEKLLRKEFPRVFFIQSEKNLGFSKANNVAFSRSRGEIVVFLNPDTEILGGALEEMVACLRSSSVAGAAGPRLLNTDGSLQTSCIQAFPTICNQVLDSELLRRMFPAWSIWGTRPFLMRDGRPARVDAISGACFMVKRKVFEEVNRFNENYFMYSDDLDLSFKITKAKYAVLYLNDCRVIHHGGKSTAKQEDHFSDIMQRESLLQFFRQAHGNLYSWAYRAAVAGIAAVRLGLVVCLAPFGGVGLHGKAPGFVFQKWSKILRWAVGLEHLADAAGTRNGI
jgi:N-acetylglucosaminyl-diphospho-decaprenol L-rhamnosyltransferase